jgi:hypothetical protein
LNDTADVAHIIGSVIERGSTAVAGGRIKRMTGFVTLHDAIRIADVVWRYRCARTLETGVAFGVSTLAIRAAQQKLKLEACQHFGVDPEQYSTHEGAAISLLEQHNLLSGFELLPEPAHLALPVLTNRGTVLDFAFIDGWHTFDYTLIDFFYIDKMLRVGGIVAFHDCGWSAVRKVLGFVRTHRSYALLPYPRVSLLRTAYRVCKDVARWDHHVRYSMRRIPGLVFLQKIDNREPSPNYFQPF